MTLKFEKTINNFATDVETLQKWLVNADPAIAETCVI